ncbi:peptidylprolyl isomerase [Algoriphagus hitonicola]|uniref:Peptidyl-prolyl cis-trans isomerase n=1 Tax=Algoriphagus hitonicola TaxID=435880 RepID=A0A1I2T962_9BACT|nr:peptidylprolyl isomerase [Algoriphagus hitonicola]SFG61382.1 peptidyl-prolyl cis-trans isomerase B (cyclophilin B) [Algoriphagus hitonicola]
MTKIIQTFILFLITLLSGICQDKSPIGKITTPMGEIYLSLDERTPAHRDSFIQMAEAGYWDSLTFNRVIPDFVAQGGCPDTPEGFNDPEYLLEPEFHPELKHVYGALGAGRDDNPGKRSARCQFYIVQNKNGLHRLDGDYTIFGHVIQGMDIVDKIIRLDRDEKDEPLQAVNLKIEILYLDQLAIEKLKNQ